jgi:glycosyltransferase involved in cell wall biosynthesis
MDKPQLSVVVASHNARASIEGCLDALEAQCRHKKVELVVIDNSTDGTTEMIRKRFPGVRLILQSPGALIPELWGVGIRQSAGEIVALTTAHFIPDKQWLSQTLKAHETPAAAVGGAIENDDSGRLVDWAVYFCRYSPYMLPFKQGFVTEIAGDNASYKREYLNRCQHVWTDGFWEPAVHAELKKAGFQLLLVPSIIIRHKTSFGFCRFMWQRFQHGIQFGGERASRFPLSKRMLYVILAPAIPLVFLMRITQRVLAKRRHLRKFVAAFPILVLFLLAWSFGELVGYLQGPSR